MQISISECQQRLQYHLLRQRAVCVSSTRRAVEGEQQASANHQALWEDVGGLVERLTNAADVIVQKSAVELRGRGAESRGMCEVSVCQMCYWLKHYLRVCVCVCVCVHACVPVSP